MRSCTLRVPLVPARATARSTSEKGTVSVMSGVRSRPPPSTSRAASNGPHRDPTTLSSSITYGAVLKVAPAAHVDLSTSVPSGQHSCWLSASPSGLPVASTTTSNAPACFGRASAAITALTPLARAIFSGCRPMSTGLWPSIASVIAQSSPSLPSPTTATASPGRTTACSRIRNAAASGSVKAAFSVVTLSGTTWRLRVGSVRYSA
mmetsp:Transcript_3337/g.10251  ORF Transcript_3337/g.10251 Transcript_3337/m.10251 type:complete len:206 (+) Transcript_3337:480-1097(+)